MLRLILLGGVALAAGAAQAGGEPGAYGRARALPPEIPYRDPAYIPPPPIRPIALVPVPVAPVFVAPTFIAPRSLALPLYNEPPPRFPTP